ncbi:MAG: bifunctional ADP-dependent NAD(P)H-hydrate dehydratase/NAD(P)H-hydrate epimerase [Pseudorhodobacter sp. PARRP1]|nr:MAG: bifunctional ADP-dependent NAD(P)H-hydrate dehydratase/NAD(P)H-hydrate epimerase [Pseudorhodobacter sp. PARRP1]
MSELLTAAQMRAIEAAAIASGAVTGLELMERAGAGVVAAVLAEWPEMAQTSQRAVVLCGPGNNGGDGFVVARLLAGRGWDVEVYLYGDAGKLPPDARVNYERWCEEGEVRGFGPDDDGEAVQSQWRLVNSADVVIDAVFGIGLSRAVAPLWPMVALFNGPIDDGFWCTGEVGTPKIIAVDMVTGLCADSGRDFEWPIGRQMTEFAAHLTVTFHRPKRGHYLDMGPKYCNRLRVVDIGLSGSSEESEPSYFRQNSEHIFLTESPSKDWMARSMLVKDGGHKFSHGHALIVSGDHGHAGAARMAARGALRIGAGLVTLASPPGAMAENAARLDAVMLRLVADAAGLAEVLADARINALCLGPGMGLDARAAGLVKVALETSRLRVMPGAAQALAVVLDADALTLIGQDQALFGLLNDRCVLTPHAGEFARLFPDIAAKLAAPAITGPAYSKVDATREAAARAGCVVLYKGADTVIAAPDGRCAINAAVYERSAPWLATAGSGDVLAGFITGLLARGFAPMQAAETAAWLHVECARSFGPGLIAEDLAEELPKVFRALGV